METPDKQDLSQVTRPTSVVTSHLRCDEMSTVPLWSVKETLIMRKRTSNNPPPRDIL